MDRAQFHAERRSGIGASDAAAVLGVSPWKTPIQVWRDKLATMDPPEPESGPLRRGLDLEPMILERARGLIGGIYFQTPERLGGGTGILRHGKHRFMICHPDALWGDNTVRAVVDAKAMSRNRYRSLVEDGLDADYIVQGQHLIEVARGMGNAHVTRAIFACFNWEDWEGPAILTVQRDKELTANMIEVEREFWSYVQSRVPPPPSSKPLPKVTSSTKELPADLIDVVRDIELQAGIAKTAEAKRKRLTKELQAALGDVAGRFEARHNDELVKVTLSPVQGRATFSHNDLAARGAIDPWKLQGWLQGLPEDLLHGLDSGNISLRHAKGRAAWIRQMTESIAEHCRLDLAEFMDYGDPYTMVRASVKDAPEEEDA